MARDDDFYLDRSMLESNWLIAVMMCQKILVNQNPDLKSIVLICLETTDASPCPCLAHLDKSFSDLGLTSQAPNIKLFIFDFFISDEF